MLPILYEKHGKQLALSICVHIETKTLYKNVCFFIIGYSPAYIFLLKAFLCCLHSWRFPIVTLNFFVRNEISENI